jgi:hypothetical protein
MGKIVSFVDADWVIDGIFFALGDVIPPPSNDRQLGFYSSPGSVFERSSKTGFLPILTPRCQL